MKFPVSIIVVGLVLLGVAGCGQDPDLLSSRADGVTRNTMPAASSPAVYEYEPADVPPEMGNYTSVFGINNSGIMVGNYGAPDGSVHGFVYRRGHFIDVAVPEAGDLDRGSLGDVNDAGIAVGSYYDADEVAHLFLRSPRGVITVMPDIGPDVVVDASGINNAGTVVGTYIDAAGATHGFILRNGEYETYHHPGSVRTRLANINNYDQITGFWTDSARRAYGFVLDHGVEQTIAFPGAVSTRATGINDAGDVTGFYNGADGVYHGFVYSQGAYASLDYPGSIDSAVFGINDRGVIVGTYDGFSFGMVITQAVSMP